MMPGFTFILINFLMNPGFLNNVHLAGLTFDQASTILGILFGFFTVFGGSAIGFLISQFWWLLFEILGGHYKCRLNGRVRKPFTMLQETYNVNNERVDLITIYDYIIHSSKDTKLYKYIDRRWNLFHTLGSTAISLIASVSLGIILKRILFVDAKINPNYHYIIIILSILLSTYMIISAYRTILSEIHNISIILIRQYFNNKKLVSSLPKEYFKDGERPNLDF